MGRIIPGMSEVEGREFFYVEILAGEGFDEIMDEALTCGPDAPLLPKDGGIIEEKVRLRLPNKKHLLAFSYRGDISGWRNLLLSYCRSNNRIGGVASDGKIFLPDGTELKIVECEVALVN